MARRISRQRLLPTPPQVLRACLALRRTHILEILNAKFTKPRFSTLETFLAAPSPPHKVDQWNGTAAAAVLGEVPRFYPSFGRLPYQFSRLLDQLSDQFAKHCAAGLVTYAWLATVLWKANEVVRREAAMKADASKSTLLCLAAALALHPVAVLWMLQRQRLWRSFALLTPAEVPTVRPEP